MLIRITNQKLIRDALNRLADLMYETSGHYFRKVLYVDDYLYLGRHGNNLKYSDRLGIVCVKAWQKNWKEGYFLMKELATVLNSQTLALPFEEVQKRIWQEAVNKPSNVDYLEYLDNAYITVMKFNSIVFNWFWANFLHHWDNVVAAYREKSGRCN